MEFNERSGHSCSNKKGQAERSKGLDTQAIIAADLDCRLAFNFYLVGTTESAAIIALCSHKNQSDYRPKTAKNSGHIGSRAIGEVAHCLTWASC